MAKLKLKLVVERDDDNQNKEALPVEPGTAAKALSRQLRITALTTILALGMVIAVTVAWFAMNREVQSDGMQMDIESTPNLIIANGDTTTYNTFKALTITSQNVTSFSFNDASRNLTPATHKTTTSASQLKYLSNPAVIDPFSGLRKDASNENTPVLDEVPAANPSSYYIEHTVLIASADKPLPIVSGKNLKVTISAADLAVEPADNADEATSAPLYYYAASVDFYVSTVSVNAFGAEKDGVAGAKTVADLTLSPTYAGTLNLANKDYASWNIDFDTTSTARSSTPVTEAVLLTGSALANVPCNAAASGDCCLAVTMRFYFDGALLKTNDKAYVHSAYLVTGDMPTLTVAFEAEE